MPTGYTAPIKDGMSFEQFVLGCARAFGALHDAPIPEAFAPPEYHATELAKARAEHARLSSLTPEQVRAECELEHRDAVARATTYREEERALRAKYEAMLREVDAWTPPTAEHVGLKRFMREQIEQSIKFDCGGDYWEREAERPQPEPDAWLAGKLKATLRDIGYHAEQHEKDVALAESRTEWVRALRESLASYTSPSPR